MLSDAAADAPSAAAAAGSRPPSTTADPLDDSSARPALRTAEAHPLLLDGAAETRPDARPAVARPLWSQRVEAPVASGPSRYFDLKGLQERLETTQRPGTASPTRTRSQAESYDSDTSSLRAARTEEPMTEHEEDDNEADASNGSIVAANGQHLEHRDEPSAELAAILAPSSAAAKRRPPPLVAPQARTPLGFQSSSRSASQTPQPTTARPTRASSRASQRQGALSPFGRAAASEGRYIARPPSAFRAAANADDDADDDGEGDDEVRRGPSVDILRTLHGMSDGELQSLLGATSRTDQHRDGPPSGAASPMARRRTDSLSDSGHRAPPTPKAAAVPAVQVQARTHALIRSLSFALSEALDDAAKAKSSAIKERSKNHEAVEYMNQQHRSRELALKELCLQHGIKEGEISRCLLRAPVFDAEATKRRIEADGHILTTPKTIASVGPAHRAANETGRDFGTTADKADKGASAVTASLPRSLQEAMLEELEGAYGASLGDASPSMSAISQLGGSSRDRSPSITSFRTEASSASSFNRLKRSDGRTRGSHADLRAEISSITSASRSPITVNSPSSKAGNVSRPPAVRSSSSASTTYRTASTAGLGEWASGLMPWAASGTSRKAAASTAPSNVKATSPGRHTISEGLVSEEPDPFEAPTKSKSTTALPEEGSKAAARREAEAVALGSPQARSRSTSVPRAESAEASRPSSRSGLGIFGTLAWRRKKPQAQPEPPASPIAADRPHGHAGEASTDTMRPNGDLTGEQRHETAADVAVETKGSLAGSVETSQSADENIRRGDDEEPDSTPTDRPIAIRRSSSKSMPVALHEAIGSEPPSPLTEKLQAQLGLPPDVLPKPTHFKAIFLATRIMTPDPSSLLYDSGKKTSELIASLASSLVGRARDEGKMVEEPSRLAGVRRPSGAAARPMSMAHAMLTQTVEDHAKRAPIGQAERASVGQVAGGPKVAPSTTFARAFGRYTRSPARDGSGQQIEPNVTRLPDTYRFTASNAPAPSTPGGAEHAQGTDAPLGLPRPPAAAVELEAIVPSEAAPPTLAKKRSKKKKRQQRQQRKTDGPGPSRRTNTGAPRSGGLDPLDEESSGDEFEVYGGKGPAAGYGQPQRDGAEDDDDDNDVDEVDDTDSDDDAGLLTDRYGFIYDATPADIRLLRQARKAATPAPACLTGIRVGVRARGGTESQSEEEREEADNTELDTEDERASIDRSSLADGAAGDDVEDLSEGESLAITGISSAPSDGATAAKAVEPAQSKRGLLSLSHSKPVAEALSVSVTSRPASRGKRAGLAAAATSSSPASSLTDMQVAPATSADTAQKATKPTSSQTVRRLLGQLQEMHDKQQTTHKAKWDDFLQRRQERLGRANLEGGVNGTAGSSSSGGGGGSGAGSISHGRRNSASSHHATGIAALASSEKAPEEDWSQGMVGINRMGATKSGKEDWKQFLSLCQAGIPLCYRAKIWAECSGANEVHEPGRYQELLQEHEGETNQCLTQIDLDVHRTMPTNIFFGGDGQGVPKLRRLLVAFSWYNPACGYCQGMNNLAATLLLTHATEEEAFWVLVCIIEKILPSEYYTSHLLVSQADQRVLIELVDELMPALSAHVADLGVDLPAVTFAWFLSLYTDCLPVETLFRVWDVMFVEGMVILFRVAVAILKMNEAELLATTSAAAFYGQVHSMTSRLFSVDRLIKLACEDLKPSIRYAVILEKRERHVADLTRELGLDAP
ncbi:uncharacterized protein PFL1_01007 [Pseudozyma flocculosa PF-1]|uniref:Rab-GAP TBC domain-containing protein n=1 Tax=Pseudozyma flocculosa TaxID=84751 RepID=A0A5C3FBD7_9BASI|nr:uncharacterized protein PFL1_01007 [Pseudozyma flocculosa PF-1]EPQ31674.1 hypothetical protein PFL1_01007 [Pseudozyma flocculosa PF-1]SPO40791.1 uncharacterized protein PSFLO_06273 [Pseudozyma flocculosa]